MNQVRPVVLVVVHERPKALVNILIRVLSLAISLRVKYG
jgi:hypothetical protein